jgi:hypothetical protein
VVALREVANVPFDATFSGFFGSVKDCREDANVNGAWAVANARLVSTAELGDASCTQLLLVTPQ